MFILYILTIFNVVYLEIIILNILCFFFIFMILCTLKLFVVLTFCTFFIYDRNQQGWGRSWIHVIILKLSALWCSQNGLCVEQWWADIIKWTRTNIRIYLDATSYTERISEYTRMQHIYRTNNRIYLYSRISTNTNINCIQGSFYSNIQIFVLNTDCRNFLRELTHASSK